MKVFAILCVAVPLVLSGGAFAQSSGGGTSGTAGEVLRAHRQARRRVESSLGTSATSPGTNSAGTAVPSGGSGTVGTAPLGTGDPKIDQSEKDVDRKVKSICKGC